MSEIIETNNIHLTPAEKLNLKNLGVSVKLYGAVGDGDADDTSAFTSALENNSRVYVPGGTYKITGELIVKENCELELAQDAVLNFRSSSNEAIPETFKCITLSSSSRLIGNHATVCVPYTFEGSVIRITANPEDDTNCVRPRYLKDINIVKAIEQKSDDSVDPELVGQHAALDNQTCGTALLIEGTEPDETENPSILWGVEASGVRIAGAFDYGIRCFNTNHEISGKTPWKYETCIDALIDGCRTGLYMDHYSNARISVTVQIRRSYMSEDNSADPSYAEYGIHLANCKYINLRNSRIIDKDPETDTLTVSDDFCHVKLDGDCFGLMLDTSLCSVEDGSTVRDCIHITTTENYENMAILGEAAVSFFDFDADTVDNYLLHDMKIKTGGYLEKYEDVTSTCFIPCTKNSTIIVRDFVFGDDNNKNRIAVYDDEGTSKMNAIPYGMFNSNLMSYTKIGEEEDNEYRITFNSNSKPEDLPDFTRIRMCCEAENIGPYPKVYYGKTNDKGEYVKDYSKDPICLKDGYLKEDVYVDAQNVIGLAEAVNKLATEISQSE